MSTAAARAGHRKRKPDPPNGKNKRRRLYATPSKTMREHRPSALAQHIELVNAGSNGTSPKSNDSESRSDYSNLTNQGGHLDSEDDPLSSELSSDTETSSDSGISSSDYDEGEDEDGNDSEPASRSDDTNSGLESYGDESDIISLPKKAKPSITSYSTACGSARLRSRIAAFLPRLRNANEDLATADDDGRIDAVADDEDRYIEMDLVLGVLKEKQTRAPLNNMIRTRQSCSSSSSTTSSSEDDSAMESTRVDAMCEMMGRTENRRSNGGRVIQEFSEP